MTDFFQFAAMTAGVITLGLVVGGVGMGALYIVLKKMFFPHKK